MPYPRSRSYATPEETFGITQKPLNDWFDAAASGMTRTGMPFSQSFEDADLRNQQRELEQERLRRQLESEQAAAEFLQNAAGAKPNALMRMIAEDPAILGSQDAPMIRDYVLMQQNQQKERRAQQPFSNRSLGPALMKQLEPQDQAMFADLTQNQGMEATEAMRTVRDFRAKEKSQLKLSELEQEAAKMNVPMSEIIASRSDANPALYLSRLIGQATAATKTTGTRAASGAAKNVALDELERYESLYAKALENGSPQLAFYERKIKELADELDRKPAVAGSSEASSQLGAFPSLNTAPPGGEAASAGAGAGAMTAGMMADALSGVAPARPTVPTLPPAPPATDAEEADLKAQQQRGVTQAQQQQLADVSWTGLKGTAAARGAEAGTPPDVISEARKAIVGGETTSKRAQRIAALARAYADEREVSIGTRQVAGLGGAAGAGLETQDIRVTPEEALLRELGYEPDAIVGQAPTRPGGPLRNVTALEAARAILADAATPFLELKKGIKQTEKAVEADVEGEEIFGSVMGK